MTECTLTNIELYLKSEFKKDVKIFTAGKDEQKIAKSLDEFVNNTELSPEVVQQKLSTFKKQNSLIDLQKYSIVKHGHSGHCTIFSDLYHDGRYSFILSYNSKPIGTISFCANENAACVLQIQGVKGQRYELKPIKWERALLSLVCDWVAENGIPEIRVVPHHQQKWSGMIVNGKLLYDVTAKRSGFSYDKEKDIYTKTVP